MTKRSGIDWIGRALMWLAVTVMFAWTTGAIASDGGRTPRPVIVIESQEACVAPPAEMRRQHAHMLAVQKDRTVRQGIRDEAVNLNGCIACHASREDNSVAGSDRNFCQSCHSFVAVKLTCFECHQPSPEQGRLTGMAEHRFVSSTHGLITPLPGAEGSR